MLGLACHWVVVIPFLVAGVDSWEKKKEKDFLLIFKNNTPGQLTRDSGFR